MPELFGSSWSRFELMRRLGRLEQAAGVRLVTLGDDLGRGVRVLEFRTGSGFAFDVLVDRCFDVGRCEFGGVPLSWQSAAGVVAPMLAWGAPGVTWLLPAFALNQVAVTSWGIAQINYVLELCGPERSATYSAVAGLLIGPFRAAAPLLGAWLVGAAGYRPMFAGCAALTLAALAVSSRWVLEPRNQVFRRSAAPTPTPTPTPTLTPNQGPFE